MPTKKARISSPLYKGKSKAPKLTEKTGRTVRKGEEKKERSY